jgi:hypothetical protein
MCKQCSVLFAARVTYGCGFEGASSNGSSYASDRWSCFGSSWWMSLNDYSLLTRTYLLIVYLLLLRGCISVQ